MHRAAVLSFALICALETSLDARQPAEPPVLGDAVLIGSVGPNRRAILLPDPVAAGLVRGDFKAPAPGDTVMLADGKTRVWEAGAIEGGLKVRSGGYAYIPFTAAAAGVFMLSSPGASIVYVNGEPRVGDPYQAGWARVPIAVRAGANALLVKSNRDEVRLQLQSPPAPVFLDTADPTLPDLLQGQGGRASAAVLVVNATDRWQSGLVLSASVNGAAAARADVEPLAPVSSRKIPFEFEVPAGLAGPTARLTVELEGSPAAGFDLRIRAPDQSRKVTFASRIDGSVQYYAIRPAAGDASPGMIFTLHGASVEAIGQADAYANKAWAWIVAPTNRRPYGFDWEDTGRLDFLEVYRDAMARFSPDPARVYLTGHSMGGHGTWQIGAQYPGLFGAIAPSAGWVDFRSYSGAEAYAGGTPIEDILRRAASPSDTLALKDNYRNLGIYVLHGDADDNVPVDQARRMKQEVGESHPDFAYHEQPGAGHWWGNQCVDWPPLMEFLQKHTVADRLAQTRTSFTTASPGISHSPCGWASVEQQIEPLRPSSVDLRVDREKRSFSGTTANVARLALDINALGPAASGIHIEIDGQSLDAPPPQAGRSALVLAREGGKWGIATAPAAKSPARSGLFKDIFRNRIVFVVGTRGTEEENAWALGKARFDAETFWYRGNGSIRIVLDKDFSPASFADRNVLLFGNADTNSAWAGLLGSSPIGISTGKITAGGRELEGPDLACLFIRPRADSRTASVGVVGGSGIIGMRLAGRVPYFVSGVGIPDWIIFGPEAMESGIGGIRSAGFFGNDWRYSAANSAWRDEPAR